MSRARGESPSMTAPSGAAGRRPAATGPPDAARDLTILKIGGSLLEDPGRAAPAGPEGAGTTGAVLDRIADAWRAGQDLIVVHGGGAELSRWLERLGIASRFLEGQRVTTPEMLPVALAVLGGLINRRLVEALLRRGCPAVGITGADGDGCGARRADGGSLGAVGEVHDVNARFYLDLLAARRLPVIASLAWDAADGWLNINADLMAAGLACGLQARRLVLMTDAGGVRGRDGALIGLLTGTALRRLIHDGAVTDGMIPKLRACESALRAGVGDIRIVGAGADVASILRHAPDGPGRRAPGAGPAAPGTRITHEGGTA